MMLHSSIRTAAMVPTLFMSSRSMATSVRVATYNILSSNLANPDYYTTYNRDYLLPQKRLTKIISSLEPEVSQHRSVICLQELSQDYAGSLHKYFSNQGYHLITGMYGNKFNGYMGVGIAVPTERYSLEDVKIARLTDTKKLPRVPRTNGTMASMKKTILKIAEKLGMYKPPFDLWDSIMYRHNQMVLCRLKDRESDKDFVVSTYHMPCMFKIPAVMVAHCAMSSQFASKYAGDLPYVYCGDFNIKPDSSMYKAITDGDIEESHPDYPLPVSGDNWTPKSQPLRSAYKEFLGVEPDFTNYAKVGEVEPFVDTLDYIFMSPEWNVTDIHELPHRSTVDHPLPNASEGSDHLMIAATLSLPDEIVTRSNDA